VNNLYSYHTPFGDGHFLLSRGIIMRIFLPGAVQPAGMADSAHDEVSRRISPELSGVFDGRPADAAALHLCFHRLSPFSERVLRAAAGIPMGNVVTYGELAGLAGCPGSARAVGKALAANPFPLAVPCHRVVSARKPPGGYQGGVMMKRYLLRVEGKES
jgi:methylated-DNA-[protein]-cysteine S-methyltransferase